ncbi:hypothetical protein T484DRAFT_1898815 [Baffinella frigidus]|nr:hypothetical protein T484DRAFT_1898815 [Cryptophyta sp. CCMP2293]
MDVSEEAARAPGGALAPVLAHVLEARRMRERKVAFNKVRHVDELAALRARQRDVGSADVDEVEQDMIRKDYKARAVNSSKHHDRAAGNNDDDLSARHHLDRTRHASCPCVSSPPMLEFKVLTVLAPDFDWLNDREGFEEQAAPAARIFRKTPITERAPPREGRRPWAESTAEVARLFHFPRKIVSGPRQSSADTDVCG